MKKPIDELANDAVKILNGARGLPPTEAVERLNGVMNGVNRHQTLSKSFVNAFAAYQELITGLESAGQARDDVWQQAIETMTTLANDHN